MPRSLKQRLRLRLLRRADNVRQNLAIVISGASLFMLGILALVAAQFLLTESMSRDIIALLGLILTISGAIIAAFGYISLSILRIFRFLLTDLQPNKNTDIYHD